MSVWMLTEIVQAQKDKKAAGGASTGPRTVVNNRGRIRVKPNGAGGGDGEVFGPNANVKISR